jgi:RNA polymerase sigma-70 factor (ECF subfamily)
MGTRNQGGQELARLRLVLWRALNPTLSLGPAWIAPASGAALPGPSCKAWLLSGALDVWPDRGRGGSGDVPGDARGESRGDARTGRGTLFSEGDRDGDARIVALVELARGGDAEAFGMLYDHYHASIYRFVYYRVGSVPLAEDITSETFFRALRKMGSFRWQGKDFGAWLTTIARNLTTDHYKSGRTRLEQSTDDMTALDSKVEGTDSAVLASLANEALLAALRQLPREQQECLVMRFLQGLSIAETARALGRSDGAVKQLQLRAVRNLGRLLPESVR